MSDALNNIGKTISDAAAGAANTLSEGANYVSKTIAGDSAEAKAEANKNVVKSDQSSLGTKFEAGKDYLSNKSEESSNKADAKLSEEKIKN